jgi:hypothetical protein
MPDAHIVLKDDLTTRSVVTALNKALKSVAKNPKVRFGEVETETRGKVTVRTYADPSDEGHTPTLVEDPGTGRHVVVEGKQAPAIAKLLTGALPAGTPKDLVERAAQSRKPRDVRRLALAQTSRPTAAHVGVVVTALRSTDHEQFDAGITAAEASPAKFEGDLHRLATESTDQRVRLRAEQVLAEGGRG